MTNQLGGTPAIPTFNPMEFLPEMNAAPISVQKNSDMNAQDPNIPKVALKMPSFLPERIRNPDAVARGDLPSAQVSQPQVVIPQQAASQPKEEFVQQHHRSDFAYAADAGLAPSFQSLSAPDPLGSKVPKPENGKAPGSIKAPSNPVQHPVLASLMDSLKNTPDDHRSVVIDGFKFTMRPLPADLYAYTMNIAQRASASQPEMAMRFNLLRAVLALVYINDEPVYQVMNAPIKKYQAFDDFAPPVPLVIAYAPRLIDLFFVQLKFKIVEGLAAEYDNFDLVESNKDLMTPGASNVDITNERLWRFKCSVPDCTHHEDVEPQFLDAAQESMAPRFCPEHGEVLTPIGRIVDLANIPLE